MVNQPAPEFHLPDLNGKMHALREHRGRVVLLNFWSAECSHAARADAFLMSYLETWGSKVALVSIASNANEPVELLAKVAAQRGLPALWLDQGCAVADLYQALTTPHLFVIDEQGILRYQGAFDDVTFRQRTPTRYYLREAMSALLKGTLPELAETPAYGCAIVRVAPD
jgi:peroxiredoxin